MSSRFPDNRIGRLFAAAALFEAFTWAGLLVGMFLKYVTDTTEAGVHIFGPIHGGAFVIYGIVTLITAVKLRWAWWVTLLALVASIPPLATLVAEWWLSRTGRLSAPTHVGEPLAPARV